MAEDGRRVVHVRGDADTRLLRDGPALRLEQPGRSPVWMPLQRIALLVVQGEVSLAPEVISAVLAAGAGLRLLRKDGAVIADVVPPAHEEPGTAAQLDEVLQQVDWRRAYTAWRMRQSLWDAARAIGRQFAVRELLRLARPGQMAKVMLAPLPGARAIFAAIAPLLALDALQLLADQGWPTERRKSARPGPDARRDLFQAMRWDALAELLRHPPSASDANAWYVAHRESLLKRGRCTLDSLRRWLADRTGDR